MCGRFTVIPNDSFYSRFAVTKTIDLKPRYNMSPGQQTAVITKNGSNNLQIMRWGLIPFWAKDPKIGYKMINARAETLLTKPSFKKPLYSKRCLIPATGFFEWQKVENVKTPYYIKLKNNDIFSFAGLYDIWKDAEEKLLRTFTIITTNPNKQLENIHNRMPIIFTQEEEQIWLDKTSSLNQLLNLLKPYNSGSLDLYPVYNLVNNPDNDNEEVIKPIH